MRPPGSPRRGDLAGSNTSEPRGSAPRERDHRGGDRPGPIPNPAVKPAFAESTAAPGCGRAGRRARGGRFSICADRTPAPDGPASAASGACARGAARRARREGPRGDRPPAGLCALWGRLRPHERRCARRLATGAGAPRGGLRPSGAPSPRPRGVAGRRAGGRAPRGRPTTLPRWRSAAWQAARISRRRTRRVISLACLFAFGAQGDPRGDVLRGRPRRTSPYRMRRGARTRSLVRALSALSRLVCCIGPNYASCAETTLSYIY